jgi:protein-disulfide isomerase
MTKAHCLFVAFLFAFWGLVQVEPMAGAPKGAPTSSKALATQDIQTSAEGGTKKQDATRAKMLGRLQPKDLFSKMLPCAGNPKGEVTVLLFVDPYCPVCHKSLTRLIYATKKLPKLRVIIHYTPLSGSDSYNAARALLVAHQQKNPALIKGILGQTLEKTLTLDDLVKEGKKAEINDFEKQMNATSTRDALRETLTLMKALQIEATPSFVLLTPKLRYFVEGETKPKELLAHAKASLKS